MTERREIVEPSLLPPQLVGGYEAFLDRRFGEERHQYRRLAAEGQRPAVMLIGCCDSRVAPEVIFNARPGEIFVVRNVANLVPPFETQGDFHGTSAALEFAVMALRVQHIVVMGHAQCGGVAAYAQADQHPLSPGDFIGKWIKLLGPATALAGPPDTPGYEQRLALASIKQSIVNLRSFACVRTLEERGQLQLHGAFFGVEDGRLLALDAASGEFRAIAADAHAGALAEPRF